MTDFLPRVHAITINVPNPLNCADFGCVANKIIDGLVTVGIPIVAIMVLYGGFQIVTAAGDPEKFRVGRRTLLYAAVGLIVILLAKSVAVIIQNTFK